MHELRFIDEEDERRRLDRSLGHVVNLEQLAALGRRRIGQLSIFDEFVEDARRHAHVLLFRYELDHIGQAVDALLGQGRGEEDGRILEEGQFAADIFFEFMACLAILSMRSHLLTTMMQPLPASWT